jgi:hypothetical protein
VTPQTPSRLCDEAIRLLGEALDKPPAELKAEVDVVERAIVALRDALIDRLRQAPTDPVRAGLERVNVALSFVVGLEYPMGGLDRNMLKQARSILEAARNEALP